MFRRKKCQKSPANKKWRMWGSLLPPAGAKPTILSNIIVEQAVVALFYDRKQL